jgi:hypothetical protein
MFSFADGELEVQPSGDSKESKAEDAGVHTPCMLNVLHERTGVLSEHLSDWVKGSALRALKAAEEKEGGDMKEVMTADVPVWFQLSHLRWSGEVEDVLKTKMESGHLLIPYGRDDYQTLILEGDGRISPLAAIVDARAAVEERKGKERLMRATRVKQELKMAIQGTNGHGGCFFVAERREDGVVRPNEMNSIHCCVSSTKCRNCGV